MKKWKYRIQTFCGLQDTATLVIAIEEDAEEAGGGWEAVSIDWRSWRKSWSAKNGGTTSVLFKREIREPPAEPREATTEEVLAHIHGFRQ